MGVGVGVVFDGVGDGEVLLDSEGDGEADADGVVDGVLLGVRLRVGASEDSLDEGVFSEACCDGGFADAPGVFCWPPGELCWTAGASRSPSWSRC
ncbi:hypothetical protein ACU4GG_21005 [Streptomyces nojiriensis]